MPNFCLSHKRVKVLARMRIGACGRGKTRRRGVCGSGAAIRPKDRRISQRNIGSGRQARGRNAPVHVRRLRGLQELSVMKLFMGSLAAGLILLAGGAQAQVRGPYMAASDVEAPYAVAPRPVPGPHFEPGPRYGYGPSLLPSTEVYSVLRDNGFSPLGIPQAARLRLHHRGDRPRRRGRPAGDRRAQRPDPPLHAGLPHGRRQLLRGAERAPTGPLERCRREPMPPQPPAPDQVQAAPRPSRPAHVASRAVPMPKASRSPPSLRRRRSSRRPRQRRSRPRRRRPPR